MKWILALLFVIAACAAPATEPQPEPTLPEPVAPPAPVEPEPEVPQLTMDEDVAEFKEKAAKVSNYEFSYADLADNSRLTRTYYIHGDKVRIELYTPATREADSYDVVYLDLTTKETAAYCEQGNRIVCPNMTKKLADPEFDDFRFEFPHEIMAALDNGEVVSSLTHEDIAAAVVHANYDGRDVRFYVHKYYGVPMYIEYGTDVGLDLRDFAFNTVSEADVTPPSGW